MMKKGRVFFGAVATLVILGVGCLVESKHSMGLATKTKSLLAAGLPGELKIAQSQDPCPRGPSVAPTKETRKIREEKFGFSFDVPTNYQTEKRQDGNRLSMILQNPTDTKLLECCKKNRLRGCGHGTLYVSVSVTPATPETRLLPELSATTLRLENIREITIAKQKAFVYITKHSLDGAEIDKANTYLNASFFTPDKRNMVAISTVNFGGKNIGSVEQKVFNIVISSFAFVI